MSEIQNKVRIKIYNRSKHDKSLLLFEEHDIFIESSKSLTAKRAAKILVNYFPQFKRRKGRYSAFAGVEILPVVEKVDLGWRAWRLNTGDNSPSGFQPPLPGRTGKANQKNNPFCDMSNGEWQCAIILK